MQGGVFGLAIPLLQISVLFGSKIVLSSPSDGIRRSQWFAKQPVILPDCLSSAPLFRVAKNTVKTVPSAKLVRFAQVKSAPMH
jgi:hypothetical protein